MKAVFIIIFLIFFVNCNQNIKLKDSIVLKLDAISNTITYDRSKIIFSKWDSSICIYDLDKNLLTVKHRTYENCFSKPILKNNRLFFPVSSNKFVCKDINSNKIIWELPIFGRCSNFDFIDEKIIIASINHFGLLIINAAEGKLINQLKYDYRKTLIPDLSPWLISFDINNFYVSNWQGNTISCFDKSGILKWNYNNKVSCLAGKSFVIKNTLFVGINENYENGRILILDKISGKIIEETLSKFEDHEIPIKLEDSIYFYSVDKHFNKYNLTNNKIQVLKTFGNDDDLSGNQMYLVETKIFYTDNNFFLNCYSTIDGTFNRYNKMDASLLGAYKYKGVIYLIF